MKRFVRHFLFLRPHTFVVYDVIHTKPGLKATWVLNSINAPELKGDQAIVKTGPPEGQPGQLSVRRVLPDAAELRSVDGYRVDGKRYPPQKNDPRSGHFRLEADSTSSEGRHSFLFVLSTAPQAPSVRLEREGGLTGVDVDGTKILFPSDGAPGGRVASKPLPTRVLER
jgi:hypothetical protein